MARSAAAPLTMPRAMTERAISASAVRTAIALTTRAALGAGSVPREDVLGDTDPGEALAALEAITAGVLEGVWPGDEGADVLARIGQAVAELANPDTRAAVEASLAGLQAATLGTDD